MSKYYPHQCPDTGRWFICEQGVDNNLAEVFDHNNVPAVLTAYRMAHCMNQDDVIRAEQKKLVDAVTSATGAPLQAQPKKTGGMRCPGGLPRAPQGRVSTKRRHTSRRSPVMMTTMVVRTVSPSRPRRRREQANQAAIRGLAAAGSPAAPPHSLGWLHKGPPVAVPVAASPAPSIPGLLPDGHPHAGHPLRQPRDQRGGRPAGLPDDRPAGPNGGADRAGRRTGPPVRRPVAALYEQP